MAFQAYQEIRYEKPVIQVFYADGLTQDFFQELLHGIEEEGLPFELQAQRGADAALMAYDASQTSRLGVGLGINASQMALHFEKLEMGKPLFTIPANAPAEMQRALGANAARLVKKLPFKNL